MFRRRDQIIAVISGIFFLFSFCAVAANKKNDSISCEAYKGKFTYEEYGLQTPAKDSGWKCKVIGLTSKQFAPLFVWSKGKDEIGLTEAKIGIMDLSAFKPYIEHAATTPEPMKSIRLNTEAYLGSPEFAKKNELTASLVEQFAPNPKAILFSPNNERILVYDRNSRPKGGKMQSVAVYRKGDAQHYLNVVCELCSANEFFSMVVNPLIQK